MKIKMKELRKLMEAASNGTGGAPSAWSNLVGKVCIIRTRISGVSIGTVRSVEASGGQITVVLDDSVRLWSWGNGSAFTLSEVATGGCEARLANNPDGFVMSDSGAEILEVKPSIFAGIKENATFGAS